MRPRDRVVGLVLGCWERGIVEIPKVLIEIGINRAAYDNALRRIIRLADKLPERQTYMTAIA
jgi:hypothetical protein